MLLKTKRGISKTNSKRTQNEPQLSAQMREIRSKSELLDAALVPAGILDRRNAAGFEIVRTGGIRRIARKYKNSGNELEKYFKKKDMTF